MCVWIELRCADRDKDYANPFGQDRDRYYLDNEECWAHSNSGCGVLADETVEGILFAKREMEDQAKAAGWLRKSRGWVCPNCTARSERLGVTAT